MLINIKTTLTQLHLTTKSSLAKVVLILPGGVLCVLSQLGAVGNSVTQASTVDTSLCPADSFQLLQLIHRIVQGLQMCHLISFLLSHSIVKSVKLSTASNLPLLRGIVHLKEAAAL